MADIIVRYAEHFGRMGSLEDTFVTSPAGLKALKAWGECYRGEVLGKHSDINSTLSDATLTVLTEDQDFIAKAVGYGLVGGCPFADRLSEVFADDPGYYAEKLGRELSGEELLEVALMWHFVDHLP